jgi:hypothetical protein
MSDKKTISGKKAVVYYVNFPAEIKGSQVNLHGENTKSVLDEFKKKFSSFSEYEDVVEVFLPTFGDTRIEIIQF